MTPDQIKPGHTYEMTSGHEWTVLRRDGDLLRVKSPLGGEFGDDAPSFARYAVRDVTPAPESDQGEKVAQAQSQGASRGCGVAELTADDWLQIEMAAKGCVSGVASEWPALAAAINKLRDKPIGPHVSSSWLQGFCEALVAGRRTPPATDAVNAELLEAARAVASQIDYLQGLWGREAITQRLVDQMEAAIARAEAGQ